MDAEDVVEAAVFAALSGSAEIADLADVYQHVPQDTQIEDGRGVLIIGDMDSEPIATKGGRDEQIGLVIAAAVVAEERRPIRAMKAAVLDVLNNLQVDRDGWRLHFLYVGAEGFLEPDTGEAYAGNFRFTVMAFAAA